jgi:hypothetical protein
MGKTEINLPSKQLELYNNLIASIPVIDRKGKTMPYTSVNGHMFSFLDKEGKMGLRLSEEDREAFIQKYNCTLMIQYERVMKEYVVVPNDLLSDTKKLSTYLKKSYDYISSLKPKPTKKK